MSEKLTPSLGGDKMKRVLLILMIAMLAIPLFYFSFPSIEATSNSEPFIPHEVKVLVVSPANAYLKGGHYLISDLVRYGFNVSQHTSDDSKVDYSSDPKTADLSQYDVVILHGSYISYPPISVSMKEVNHFINYGGVLIVIGNALFWNETTREFWGSFQSEPILKLEQRLGVDFTAWLRDVGATYKHNNGTFTLATDSITGLPSNLTYITHNPGWINYQVAVTPKEARKIYDFTTENGETTSGLTYYKNTTTGAVGIYIQGSYIYSPPEDKDSHRIRYFGFTDVSKRSSLLASLMAYALGRDINTIIKPQPLTTIRLDWLGGRGWDKTYLNASLRNFNSIVDKYGIIPTVAFTDSPGFDPKYWQKTVPKILSQLKGEYRDWEYTSSLRNIDSSSMNQSQIESLIRGVKANYTALGMDLFSTVAVFAGYWNLTTLDAMVSENLYLLEMSGEPGYLEKYYFDWWNLRVASAQASNVIVHSGAQMSYGWDVENFTQINPDPNVAKNILHYEYFLDRDKWALAVVRGFPTLVYNVWDFRRNEVGTYSLQTVYANLTSEVPDIRFVPLVEAGLYFGNKWMTITNPVRIGSKIEFDVDASAVPDVVSIGKGMFWLRMSTNETIQEVSINDKPWFYFDDHTIRLPASSVRVKVTLGERINPTVIRAAYKVTETSWNGERIIVSMSATPGLNVSIRLSIPVGDAFCSEAQWNYKFDASRRVLDLWAISDADGLIVFQVGADISPPVIWKVERSPTWYNVSVTITANITDLQTGVKNVTLDYSSGSEWINVTMVIEAGLYTGVIPPFSYGTVVRHRLNASDAVGNWRVTEISSYKVADNTPPEIGTPQWSPARPYAGQSVFVVVSVSEPEYASGVQSVMLYYYLDQDFIGSLNWVNMTYGNGGWQGAIPGQNEGTMVSFFVVAYDRARNVQQTPTHYTFVVGGGGSALAWLPFLLIGGVLAVAIGSILYFIRFRRVKKKNE